MEQAGRHSIVRHWTFQQAREELIKIEKKIESKGLTINDLRYRAEEWDLEPSERVLLERYEKFRGMTDFAQDTAAH